MIIKPNAQSLFDRQAATHRLTNAQIPTLPQVQAGFYSVYASVLADLTLHQKASCSRNRYCPQDGKSLPLPGWGLPLKHMW